MHFVKNSNLKLIGCRKLVEKMIHQKKNRSQRTSKIIKSRQSYSNGHLPYHLLCSLNYLACTLMHDVACEFACRVRMPETIRQCEWPQTKICCQIKQIDFKLLISNRSQMTSKCDKNKNVARKPLDKCVTDVLTTFWYLLWSFTEQMHSNIDSACFIQLFRERLS